MAKWFRGGAFCTSPFACRIGSMDCPAKRRIEHVFLDADDGNLFLLRPTASIDEVSSGSVIFLYGINGQAHVNNIAICIITDGLLATSPLTRTTC